MDRNIKNTFTFIVFLCLISCTASDNAAKDFINCKECPIGNSTQIQNSFYQINKTNPTFHLYSEFQEDVVGKAIENGVVTKGNLKLSGHSRTIKLNQTNIITLSYNAELDCIELRLT
jgi:hypothetical protein